MTTLVTIVTVIAFLCIVLLASYKAGKRNGRITERNDLLEKGIKDAHKANDIQNQPDMPFDDFIAKLQRDNKKQ